MRARCRIRNSIGQGRVVLKRAGEYSRGRGDLVLEEPLNGWGYRLRCCHFALRFRMPGEILRAFEVLVNDACVRRGVDNHRGLHPAAWRALLKIYHGSVSLEPLRLAAM